MIIVDTGPLVARSGGAKPEAAFLRSLATEDFTVAPVTPAWLERTADLIGQYADLPLGAVDASVVALAEELGVGEVATLDRRHFSIVRPRHLDAFTLLP
ncbi:PIN domain-containing protein [Kribbella sp. HUAS MG21]|uniref:PIN domain-containing protein n=1 Tax=Kribbella sp. HUAS MG21 TaxID=3160966 RepID=A0AAU7TP57_9ACTN